MSQRQANEIAGSPALRPLLELYSRDDIKRFLSTRFALAHGKVETRDFRRLVQKMIDTQKELRELVDTDKAQQQVSKWAMMRVLERLLTMLWTICFFDYDLTRMALSLLRGPGAALCLVVGLVCNLLKFYMVAELVSKAMTLLG